MYYLHFKLSIFPSYNLGQIETPISYYVDRERHISTYNKITAIYTDQRILYKYE